MENSTDHKPGSSPFCVCGAEEVFFEGYALDDGDLGPTVGYGCDAQGHPYLDELDRMGFHINPRRVIDTLPDEVYDQHWERITEWENKSRRRPGRRG